MLDLLKRRQFTESTLEYLIIFALFFPFFYSKAGTLYSPDVVLVNMFAVLYILSTAARGGLRPEKRFSLSWVLLPLLLAFNAWTFYVNLRGLNWYMGQINVTISFLFFMALLRNGQSQEGDRLLDTFLKIIILSNLVGMIPYFFNQYGFSVYAGNIGLVPMEGQFDERRYNWIYSHKSEYAFMLILFLALIVTYRHRFAKRWMYYAGVAVMLVGLVISNTRTSMVAALFIFVGLVLDQLRKQPKEIRRRYALYLIPLLLLMAVLVYLVSRHRNLLTLGSRTYIWAAGIDEIRENPYGIGTLCGLRDFPVPVWPGQVSNCHNVFLNLLLQFSIPSGILCTVMFAVIIAASIRRKPNFLTLGIWAALLIPLNMDWCMLIQQYTMFLFTVYFLFFHSEKDGKMTEDGCA